MSAPVLVTGGAGYIGAHTCKALAASGYRPVVYDNLVSGHRAAVRWGPFEYGDILDRARLDEVMHRHRPVAAVHFAAFAYVGESIAEPGKYYRNNVAGSLTLFEAIRDHGIGAVVFSSSCAVYGTPERLPITEATPKEPINPYGMSKLMCERMLIDLGVAGGPRWMALRYFNAAGDDPDGETGEDHDPETRLVPLVLAAAGRSDMHVEIYGADYPTPDGTCIRDYVHVSDLADAHVAALRALAEGAGSQALNLGTGKGASVREIVATAEAVTGLPVRVHIAPRRKGDPAALVADAGPARDLLGWRPVRSDLDTIVRTAWRWHQGKGRP